MRDKEKKVIMLDGTVQRERHGNGTVWNKTGYILKWTITCTQSGPQSRARRRLSCRKESLCVYRSASEQRCRRTRYCAC